MGGDPFEVHLSDIYTMIHKTSKISERNIRREEIEPEKIAV